MKRRTCLIVASLFALALSLGFGPTPARAAEAPRELRIGYQKIGALLILKQRGSLEKRLAGENITVRWVQFQSGPPLIEALNAGAIDFGYTGDTPPIVAQASGVDFVYVASIPQPGASNAILVRNDANIHSLADLRGKKVALVKGSSAHNVLVQVLKKANVGWSDVTPVYLQPADAGAALRSGSVDAWSIWDPFYALGERFPGVHVLTTAQGVAPSNAFFLATRSFATRYPAVVTAIVDETTAAWHWAEHHQAELAAVLADASGVPVDVEKVVAARGNYEIAFVTPQVVRQQQAIADTFSELGLIPHPIVIGQAVWTPGSSLTATREVRK
ncbi:MAG: aliphatic sulfonate ABC transporter substrate-binding protein [Candidatus Velthaea sp.]